MAPGTSPAASRRRCGRAVLLVVTTLVSMGARAAPVDVNADVIWDDNDARQKCPRLCDAKHLYWIGTWRKVGWMDQPVCACDDKAPSPPPSTPISVTIGMPGSGMSALPPAAVTRYDNTDFPANDIRNQPAASYEQCAATCLGAADCRAFTFATDQRRCYLKSGMSGTSPTNTASSGVVHRTTSAPAASVPLPAAGPSCSVGGTARCPGCSVTCGPGQNPICEHGVEGAGGACERNTSCRCQ